MKTLQLLLDEYQLVLDQDYDSSTASFYFHNMKLYVCWVLQDNPDWTEERTIRLYLAHEKERGMSANTIIARYSSFLNFFKWVQTKSEFSSIDPMSNIRRPKKPKEPARRAPRPDVIEVIDSIPFANWWFDQRDRAILQILLSCGLRIGELCKLKVSDIDTANWTLSVPPLKFSKRRSIPLGHDGYPESNEVRRDIDNWLRLRPTNLDTDMLFLGFAGPYAARGPLGTDGARAAIKSRCKAANVAYFNPHSIRHCFATQAINTPGMRVEILQMILGHSCASTTLNVYAEVLNDRIMEEARDVLARVNSW